MTRVKASFTHLLLSVLGFSLFLSLVFFVWYAYPFNLTQGIAEIVYLMAGVDVVLGPLLTLIVFKSGKKGLKMDLTLIALMQVAALVYGASVIYKERPAYVVFVADRFDVVGISEVDVSQSQIADQAVGVFDKPIFVFGELPMGNESADIIIEAMAGGKDIDRLPRFYRDYQARTADVLAGTKPATEVAEKYSISNAEQLHYAPVVGKKRDIIALIDKNTGLVVGYNLADPYATE